MNIFFLALAALIAVPCFAIEPRFNSTDPYEILGVDPTVSDEAIDEAFKTLVKQLHPDQGGNGGEDFRNVVEAGQFLKKNRTNYDRRVLPFNGIYKRRETRPVLFSWEERLSYEMTLLGYLRMEGSARALAGAGEHPIFMTYAMLNLRHDHGNYSEMEPWHLAAYRDLIVHTDLVSLSRMEQAGIVLHDPVEALQILLPHYDNLSIRLSTLSELFAAYDEFYLVDVERSRAFLLLLEEMVANRQIYELRYTRIRELGVRSLKRWLAFYRELPRDEQLELNEQYLATRDLLAKLEPLTRKITNCVRRLLGA